MVHPPRLPSSPLLDRLQHRQLLLCRPSPGPSVGLRLVMCSLFRRQSRVIPLLLLRLGPVLVPVELILLSYARLLVLVRQALPHHHRPVLQPHRLPLEVVWQVRLGRRLRVSRPNGNPEVLQRALLEGVAAEEEGERE
ncbi:hypothetical protein J3459_013983 [Metarhizium acridum]|nr:hypothetical protein J3459_013983 [Metarhizium acridum]